MTRNQCSLPFLSMIQIVETKKRTSSQRSVRNGLPWRIQRSRASRPRDAPASCAHRRDGTIRLSFRTLKPRPHLTQGRRARNTLLCTCNTVKTPESRSSYHETATRQPTYVETKKYTSSPKNSVRNGLPWRIVRLRASRPRNSPGQIRCPQLDRKGIDPSRKRVFAARRRHFQKHGCRPRTARGREQKSRENGRLIFLFPRHAKREYTGNADPGSEPTSRNAGGF